MTSLDMAGFSISTMKADQAILHRLDAATKAPNWPVGVDGNHPPAKIPIPMPPSHSTKSEEADLVVSQEMVTNLFICASNNMIHLSKILDADNGRRLESSTGRLAT